MATTAGAYAAVTTTRACRRSFAAGGAFGASSVYALLLYRFAGVQQRL